MATKSALISAVNGYITATITYLKHRSSMLEVVNELFSTSTSQSINTGSDKFYCDLKYTKTGNQARVSGWIQNKYAVSKSGVTMITIPNSVFYAKTGQDTIDIGVTGNTSLNQLVSMNLGNIYLIGTVAADQRIYINIPYQVND